MTRHPLLGRAERRMLEEVRETGRARLRQSPPIVTWSAPHLYQKDSYIGRASHRRKGGLVKSRAGGLLCIAVCSFSSCSCASNSRLSSSIFPPSIAAGLPRYLLLSTSRFARQHRRPTTVLQSPGVIPWRNRRSLRYYHSGTTVGGFNPWGATRVAIRLQRDGRLHVLHTLAQERRLLAHEALNRLQPHAQLVQGVELRVSVWGLGVFSAWGVAPALRRPQQPRRRCCPAEGERASVCVRERRVTERER